MRKSGHISKIENLDSSKRLHTYFRSRFTWFTCCFSDIYFRKIFDWH